MTTHWTNTTIAQPIFSSVIDAHGPNGNTFAILRKARALMRQIGISQDRIEPCLSGCRTQELEVNGPERAP